MACYSPLTAWRPDEGGSLLWKESKNSREIEIPCGQCIGCRLERSRQWAVRCVHESQMHEHSVFITLTYDDTHLVDPSLRYSDFQKFLKRLRKRFSSERQRIRYFCAGEYGEETQRPHFHALLFGCWFADRKLYRTLASGARLYTSDVLSNLWPFGFSSIGDVTFESAAYVARYVMKKVTGDMADEHYKMVDLETGEFIWRQPEFCHMSLKPGIGATWFEKFGSEVTDGDYVVIRGTKMRPPKYYDRKFDESNAFDAEYRDFVRQERALRRAADNSRERLVVREVCAKARLNVKRRGL